MLPATTRWIWRLPVNESRASKLVAAVVCCAILFSLAYLVSRLPSPWGWLSLPLWLLAVFWLSAIRIGWRYWRRDPNGKMSASAIEYERIARR
jgi:hypothetical protein